MEGAGDLEERSKLEANVFARILPAIDVTRGAYGREFERGSTPVDSDLRTDLAKCLSALSSIKLMWPLPQDTFDAEVMLLLEHVFEDLKAILESLSQSANRNRISEWNLRSVRLAFDAVVDVARIHATLRQITSSQPIKDHARLRHETISAGLTANVNRTESVANLPSEARPNSRYPPGNISGAFREQNRHSQPRHEMETDSSTSSKLLLMELEKSLRDWLRDWLPEDASVIPRADTMQGAADADYHGDISRLVKAHWSHNACRRNVVIDWEVDGFIAQCLGGDANLEAVLTVTGDARSAYGVTCREYVKWQWGNLGLQVLRMVYSLFRLGSRMETPAKRNILGLDVSLQLYGSSRVAIQMCARDTTDPLAEYRLMGARDIADPLAVYWLMLATSVVQTLAWVASVFRIPPEGPPHCSLLRLPFDQLQNFDIKLGILIPAPHTGSSCWHDLLPNTTVASGFPTRTRESGLDVEWELMLDLADVIFRTDLSKLNKSSPLGNGFFYSGVNTLLYPISQSRDIIKWHFDASGKQAVPPPERLLRIENEEQHILSSKHLIGFAAQSEVRLGTRKRTRDYARMRSVVGSIERGRPEIALDAFSATIGKAPVTVSAGMRVKFPSTLRATVDPQKRRYDEIVKKTKDQAVILYDCGHQPGAWLVPQLSVILDLVYYRMFKEQWGEPPRYAKARADGGSAASEILKDPLVYQHKLSSILEDNSNFKIMDLVKEIYEAMLKRRILHEAPAGGSLTLHRERLYGWDLLEIADAPDQSFRREIEVHQTTSRVIAQYPSWLPLTQHIPVYLGQDLGHVISVGNQPLPMRDIRNQEKCLVANVRTLQNLLRSRDACSDFHLDCELVWELTPAVSSMFCELEIAERHKGLTPPMRIEHCLQRLQGSKDHVCGLRDQATTLCPNGLVIFGPEDTKLSRFNELVDSLGIGALQVTD